MKEFRRFICLILAILTTFCVVACSGNNEESSVSEDCTVTGNHDYQLIELDPFGNEINKCGLYKCSTCDKTLTKTITSEDLGLPIVEFSGSLEGISKDNKVKVGVKYSSKEKDFTCDATLKVQGASSAAYPKKNFTIQLFEEGSDFDKKYKVEMREGWGKQSKYCLKANWIDFSHARNVVSAKLYGEVSESRNLKDKFAKLVNGGAIDGFPVVIYLNGSFHGLYTWNIPKDKWLFDMDDEDLYEALVMADDWHMSTSLNEPVADDFESTRWELEYCSTEDTEGTKWVVDSLNEMIYFLNNYKGEDFAERLRYYVNVERAIDCMIHTTVINGLDNTSKNIIWVTYDGIQWMPCVYDMDSTWGIWWHGKEYYSVKDYSIETMMNGNVLWRKLFQYYKDDIIQRYFELRETVYSVDNIKKQFGDFIFQIPKFVYECEAKRWEEIPSKNTSCYEQIVSFGMIRLDYLDKELNNLKNPIN